MAECTIYMLFNYLKSAFIAAELFKKLWAEVLLIIIKIMNCTLIIIVKEKTLFKGFKKKLNLSQLRVLEC